MTLSALFSSIYVVFLSRQDEPVTRHVSATVETHALCRYFKAQFAWHLDLKFLCSRLLISGPVLQVHRAECFMAAARM